MKTLITILSLGILTAVFVAGLFYGRSKPVVHTPQQITLEQILSIKELHLVKHTYNDLFFIHKHNDEGKAIRAIVQVPVVITAYLDLKEMQLIKQHDSVVQVVLPHAKLNAPHYQVENMVVRETRSFQVHVGKDQYAQVGQYVQQRIATRIDSVRTTAVSNRILAQAEVEGKAYLINLLRELGYAHVRVTIADESSKPAKRMKQRNLSAKVDFTPFGFLQLK